MKIPKWAPPDLVEEREDCVSAIQEIERHKKEGVKILDSIPYLNLKEGDEEVMDEGECLYLLYKLPLEILDVLVSHNEMEDVWKSLTRRAGKFKYYKRDIGMSILDGQTQSLNLCSACVGAIYSWENVPKRSRTKYREVYLKIAEQASELSKLIMCCDADLLPTHPFEGSEKVILSETVEYLDPGAFKTMAHALEADDQRIAAGDNVERVLRDMLPSVPKILWELSKRATECADMPFGVSQPNATDAKTHYFIRYLSDYFVKSYGQPLNAQVATIARAVLRTEVGEDNVRALIRADKASLENKTRKKIKATRK